MRPNSTVIALLVLTLMVAVPILLIREGLFKPVPIPQSGISLLVLAKNENKIYNLKLEEYIVGVVSAEMPSEFGLEALKAQAVAARTLTIRRLRRYGGSGSKYNPNVDFSDDPGEGQAWVSPDSIRARRRHVWDDGNYNWKARKAVAETEGVIMMYQDRPIDALYHSTCGGITAAADELWHFSLPYLVSTRCGYDTHSPWYQSQVVFSWRKLAACLGVPQKTIRTIRILQKTATGRVGMVGCGQYRISGSDVRFRLKLPSNKFYWKSGPNGVVFVVSGYGHGVGMCQYGADGMARKGYNYQEILHHYYRRIQFVKMKSPN